MPASATGVSKQRRSPKVSVRPSVIRKTPPRRPTSSPKTRTRSSAWSASRSAMFSAFAMVIAVVGVWVVPAAPHVPVALAVPAASIASVAAIMSVASVISVLLQLGSQLRALLVQLGCRGAEHVIEQAERMQVRVLGEPGAHLGRVRLGLGGDGRDVVLGEQTVLAQPGLQPVDRIAPAPLLSLFG